MAAKNLNNDNNNDLEKSYVKNIEIRIIVYFQICDYSRHDTFTISHMVPKYSGLIISFTS